jgi:hypothetical protein
MRIENQSDADRDQQRAEQKNEANAKQETHRALTLLRGFSRGKDGRCGFTVLQQGTEKVRYASIQNLISWRDCQSKSIPAQMTSSPMIPKSLGTIILRGGLCA